MGRLLDRQTERKVMDHLVASIRAGQSEALVLRGEAGVGKTAMLDYLRAQAQGHRMAQAAGAQAEQELAFAALHQLCAPMLRWLDRLPGPQREALRTVLGLSTGSPPDRFLVGLAVLGLLAETARERPLICMVDDAQWLDRASAQVLAFVARRLQAESVAMVFAVRDPYAVPELAGLQEITIGGLPDEDARALWDATHRGPVDERVVERIIAETRGNPLAVLELPRAFTPMELASGFGSGAARLPRRIEESFVRQVAPMPADTRRLLLVAAAEPVGDPALVFGAAERLGIGSQAATPAEAAGLLEFGTQVRFRHPLVRSAIYQAASPQERRRVHEALAQVTDPELDPDRRAWHRAQAATGPDEEVAQELEHRAARAHAKGGFAAAASFLERATELTPDPASRGERALAAANARHQAGGLDAARRLLVVAESAPQDELKQAESDLLRAQIAFTTDLAGDAPTLLLKAAARLEQLDPRRARDTYLDALRAAWYSAHLATGATLREVAEAARTAPEPTWEPRPLDLLLDGLAVLYADGYTAAAPALRQALASDHSPDPTSEDELRWLWFASNTCLDLCDSEAGETFTSSFVQAARDTGAFAAMPIALTTRIVALVFAGELPAAATLLEEHVSIAEATETPAPAYAEQLIAAWQGQEKRLTDLIAVTTADAERRREGLGLLAAAWMQALLYNSLGRYDEALVAAQRATEPQQEMGVLTWAPLIELVTSATRTGRPEIAADAVRRLTEFATASDADCALGVAAACRGLISEGAAAQPHFLEAIERLSRTRMRGQLARTHLHYGEWLRRQGHSADAQHHLHTAHDLFTAMGMDAFAELAAHELAALGRTVPAPEVETISQLTAQESQVARFARDGLSNAEIAARLFISPRTVEWHLGKVFAKLQITSRRQLRN